MTGVDRVEFAYLEALLARAAPVFGLVRTSLGFALLDRDGCAALRDRIAGNTWGAADRLSRISRGIDPVRARAEADVRRLCRDRCLPIRLSRMLRRHLPRGIHYLNTGHSNLTDRVLTAVRLIPHARVGVLVHDTIPLDHPDFQRRETVRSFANFLRRVARFADLVICNSAQTEADLARHAPGLRGKTVVAHLGVDLPVPGTPPRGPWEGAPFFVTLGTIEPRKNHALLLYLWPEIPEAHLLICGSRGWQNREVFDRLDAAPERVHELPGLDDGAVFGLLAGSAGLLFPSHAEGFGLPPVEAASLGVPVLCNDLPIYREVLGDIPVYVNVSERYLWRDKISQLAEDHRAGRRPAKDSTNTLTPPDWEAHFKTVLTEI